MYNIWVPGCHMCDFMQWPEPCQPLSASTPGNLCRSTNSPVRMQPTTPHHAPCSRPANPLSSQRPFASLACRCRCSTSKDPVGPLLLLLLLLSVSCPMLPLTSPCCCHCRCRSVPFTLAGSCRCRRCLPRNTPLLLGNSCRILALHHLLHQLGVLLLPAQGAPGCVPIPPTKLSAFALPLTALLCRMKVM